jgi:hypothetical protein
MVGTGVVGGTVIGGNIVGCNGGVTVVVVVAVVGVGRVGITIGTIIPVRMIFTTVFINGYRPR